MSVRRVALVHRVDQEFAHRVRLATHWLRLCPAPHAAADIVAHALGVRPAPHFLNRVRDAFANQLVRLDLPDPVDALRIEASLVIDLRDANPLDFLVDAEAATHPFAYAPHLAKELAPYLVVPPAGARLARWLGQLERTPAYVVDRLDAVNRAVHARRAAAAEARPPGRAMDLDAVLAAERVSAWDLAWLLTVSLRALGIAARFVSGYRLRFDGDAATASLHAWAEAYVPGAGWIGLDPAQALFTTDAWVPLACAPEPPRTEPITGFREACDTVERHVLEARVLTPVPPAWPFADDERTRIDAVARGVDAALAARGVRLAVGREVALVWEPGGAAAEWTTTAIGPGKRELAGAYAVALCRRLLPGGVVHAGTGEWYAGEPLPRWRLTCLGRGDGVPLWPDATPARDGPPASPEVAAAFAASLAGELGLAPGAPVPAYEDPLQRLWRDPASCDVMPRPGELADPERRRLLAERLCERSLGAVVGWVLPLAWDAPTTSWRSGAWRFRRTRLHLVGGTLPMGFRLPLQSLQAIPGERPEDAEVPRTALCIEARDGRLCLFVPPLDDAAGWIALMGAIARVAARHAAAVVVEGYEPPDDPRVRRVVIEPDAGVLRVTLPPVIGRAEQVATLDAVHAEAAALGLLPERRAAGGVRLRVGGATSVVLGGPTPDDSPWLRRPELLRALVVHWQRHPSLSRLFATRSIGAAGCAPRVDEGRADALYELDIALERLSRADAAPPWLGDRLLRHLLVDATGDVRRAELCMADLYDPAGAPGRLGRVALRGIETPPHPQLAALHSLLVAAIVARFAADPGVDGVAPWGDALDDRLLLPAVLWDDFADVVDDLAASGHAVDVAWFRPFFDRHFPVLGGVHLGDHGLELRLAHEPWPVLAEEATAAGMARFVDPATERLQVLATGLSPSRHVLACNGRRVPLRATRTRGAYVAGVRYKTSNPPATLHPTVPPVGALVFDLIDDWTGRVAGGCTWVPAPARPVGPMALPAAASELDRGAHAARRPPVHVVPRPAAGRFVATGSGATRMASPPAEPGDAWALDLTGASA